MQFSTEQDFNREIIRFLKEKIKNSGTRSIKIVGGYDRDAPDNYILRDFTFLKDKSGEWKLYGGLQEIDVVIYQETIPRKKLLSGFIKTTGVGARGNIIVPAVVIELKKAKRRGFLSNFPSHDAVASNAITGDIKRLYPRVKAIFAFDNFEGLSKPEESISFRRMLYNFDYVCLNWETEKEDIWAEIRRWLKL